MKELWSPDMVIAGIVTLGCIVLIAMGIDGEVKSILGMGAAWAFGKTYATAKKTTKKG